MKAIWVHTLAWTGTVTAALALGFMAPTESAVMGRLPPLTTQLLMQQRGAAPAQPSRGPTLALVGFHRDHRSEIDSWIHGLQLHATSTIAWVRMPVVNDPGDAQARAEIEGRLMSRHASATERARVVPVFTDRSAFVRAAGLSGLQHASVLVIGRDGEVLARAEGRFDEDKALALRETLLAQPS